MRLGPYEVTGELGRGGLGVVHRARAPGGAEVAIKILHRQDPEHRARFERERALVATLGEKDGFVPLIDAGEAGETAYFVMPLLRGGTLREKLAKGPLALAEVVAVAQTLARALARIHERGIVHRDLKPANVLYTEDGRPLVADLGLAKGAGSDPLTKTGDFHGTAGYMSPEQIQDAKRTGPPADVFAWGAIVWECLAGRPAFRGDSLVAILTRTITERAEPIARVRPETPPWLARAVDGALAPTVAERFADGSALLRALDGAEPARPRALGLVLALALVTTIIIAMSAVRRPPPAVPEAELEAVLARPLGEAAAQELVRAHGAAAVVRALTVRAEIAFRSSDWRHARTAAHLAGPHAGASERPYLDDLGIAAETISVLSSDRLLDAVVHLEAAQRSRLASPHLRVACGEVLRASFAAKEPLALARRLGKLLPPELARPAGARWLAEAEARAAAARWRSPAHFAEVAAEGKDVFAETVERHAGAAQALACALALDPAIGAYPPGEVRRAFERLRLGLAGVDLRPIFPEAGFLATWAFHLDRPRLAPSWEAAFGRTLPEHPLYRHARLRIALEQGRGEVEGLEHARVALEELERLEPEARCSPAVRFLAHDLAAATEKVARPSTLELLERFARLAGFQETWTLVVVARRKHGLPAEKAVTEADRAPPVPRAHDDPAGLFR